MDPQLADRLSGGITVSGSGKGSVYVRSGWIEKLKGKQSHHGKQAQLRESFSSDVVSTDPLLLEVARLLQTSETEIQDLWKHPTVRGMMLKRRLKLDEWSEL